eukprot:1044741-Alexandrium_andersonii.AAC.1
MADSTVGRWEALLCDNIIGASRRWYADMADLLQHVHRTHAAAEQSARCLTLEFHTFSGDATNSSVVQSLK